MPMDYSVIDFEGKLPARLKVYYGLVSLADGAMMVAFVHYMALYLTDYILFPAALMGIALGAGRIWDAITDPTMGIITDRTRTRFGRRRPWLLWGAVPLALTWIALWNVPSGKGALTTVYIFTVLCLFQTARTVVMVPYLALSAELTTDYHERSSVQMYRSVFQICGSMLGAYFITVARMFEDVQHGFSVAAIITAIVCVAVYVVTFLGVRENPDMQNRKQPSFLGSFSYLYRNRPYVVLCLYFVITITAFSFSGGFLVYVVKYWLQKPAMIPFLLVTMRISSLLWLPILQKMSLILGKKRTTVISLTTGSVLQASAYLLLQRDMPSLAFVWCGLIGMLGATSQLFPFSLAAETVDLDELETGYRKEGVYYSFLTFLMKCDSAVAVSAMGFLLAFSGFVPNQEQTAEAIFRFRFFHAIVPGAVLLFAALVFGKFFNIDTETAKEVRRQLQERKAEREMITGA